MDMSETLKDNLRKLNKLYAQGLIDKDDFNKRKEQIVDALTGTKGMFGLCIPLLVLVYPHILASTKLRAFCSIPQIPRVLTVKLRRCAKGIELHDRLLSCFVVAC
jgi:hypothetical protein